MKRLYIDLPTPHAGQLEVMRSGARWKVLRCGRRWGKSLIAQEISIKGMLKAKHIAYVTPQFKLAKKFFKVIKRFLPAALMLTLNQTDLTIELKNGGTISFYSGENLDAMRGSKFHTVIVDEAAYVKNFEEGWNNSIRPTLSDYKGNAYFISTPRGKEFFYALSLKGEAGEKGYATFNYTTYDNPFIARSEVDAAKAELPREIFNQEYLGIASANAGAVIDGDTIEKNTIKELSTDETVVFGIDVAKYNDYTVITGLDIKGRTTYFDRFRKNNTLTRERIMALPKNIMKVIDATHGSLGDGIFEELVNLGCENLIPFAFTGTSKPQIITEMILDIEKGNVKYNEITAKEISIFEYSYSSTGHIKYGAASGGHDDCVISLALANKYRKTVLTSKQFANSFG